MKYIIYEYGRLNTAKECKTLHEALNELHKGKPNKEYRIKMIDAGHNITEVITVRYKDIQGFITTEIL